MKKKPTRRDLLIAIGSLQNFIGMARSCHNDRNQNRQAQVDQHLDDALDFCIEVRSFDPPLEAIGPWAVVPRDSEKII